MSLVHFYLAVILLISTFIIGNILFRGCTLLKNITVALSLFLIEYYFVSVIFLWLNIFNVLWVLKSMTVLNAGILFFYRKKLLSERIHISFDKREIIMAVIIILLIPLIITKSEDIRTSSDMGMYFEKAVVLMGEDTGVIKKLNEIQVISENVDAGVLELQEQLFGIYIRGSQDGKTIYDYHSLPTWVTFLALFGKIFGLYHCAQALSVLYITALLCVYFCCENIARSTYGKYIAVAVFSLSPVIIYVSKATLTEIAFLAVFFSGCMWLSEKDIKIKFLSFIYFALLGFIHISMYMYMPIIIVVLMYLFINRKEKVYAYVNILTAVFYMVSIFYCHDISYMYTRDQLLRFTFLGDNLKSVVIALVGIFSLAVLVQVLLLIFGNRVNNWLDKRCSRILPIVIIMLEIVILAGTFIIGYNLAFTDAFKDTFSAASGSWNLRQYYVGEGWSAVRHLNMINILMCTGIVSVPLIIFYSFYRKNKQDVIDNCLYMICLYSIAIFTFIQVDTPNNYYASRYFVLMVIPSITLLMARIVSKSVITKMMFVWIICFNLYFDRYFIDRGSFAGQYQLLEDVLEQIPEEAVVVVRAKDKSLNQILINNLREINQNMVFNYKNAEEIKDFYGDKPLYFITSQSSDKNKELIWYKKYSIMGNLGGGDGKYMTEEISSSDQDIYIYLIDGRGK